MGENQYILYFIQGKDGEESYDITANYYLIEKNNQTGERGKANNALILAAGHWGIELHDEIWEFNGYWNKSKDLFDAVQKASWDDVILDRNMKDAIRGDVNRFFDSQDVYKKLKVPWKRGIIYYGPPGNGKTISVKSVMHELQKRKDSVPSLYVRSLG